MESIFEKVVELQKKNQSFVLATLVNTSESTPRNLGARMLIFPDGKIFGTIGGGMLEKKVMEDARKLFSEKDNQILYRVYDLSVKKRDKKNIALGMLCGGQAQVLLEYFSGGLDLVICGAGHIAQNLSRIAEILEWNYAVIDNRPEFVTADRFPKAIQRICADFKDGLKKVTISFRTAIVIVTYGHRYDTVCLVESLKTPAYYIGMIGSKNKVQTVLSDLKNRKIEIKKNVYAPVGLDIGADSPAEIALSIAAEILAVKNQRSGQSMRLSG